MTGWQKQFDGKFWMQPLLEEIAIFEIQPEVKKISGRELDHTAEIIGKGKHQGFYNFKHLAAISKESKWFCDLFLNKNFLEKIREYFEKYKKEEKNTRKILFQKEKIDYWTAKKLFIKGYALSKFTEPAVLREIEDKIKEIAEKRFKANKNILGKVDTFDELNIFQREERELLKLALLLKQKKSYKKVLKDIQFEFGLLDYIKKSRPIGKAVFFKKAKVFREMSEAMIIRKLKLLEKAPLKSNNLKKRFFKKYHLTKKEQKIFNVHAELAHIRLELRALWASYYCEIYNSLKRFAKSQCIGHERLSCLRVKEYENFLKSRIAPMQFKLPRKILIYKCESERKIFYGKEASAMIKRFEIPLAPKNANKLCGEIANQGYVRGKARVIHWNKKFKDEMKKMKIGEILIVTQTKPDMMEAIRKAAGIITNEGGMVSHAAIISRELKLPCLMKTEYATEIFKTGDEIVLDCLKGEVYKNDSSN